MTEIIERLNALCNEQGNAIEEWFTQAYVSRETPVYSSVDVRHAGFKLAPVDTNLFPAGFNNISDSGEKRAISAFTRFMKAQPLRGNKLLLMIESHTRNVPYFDNVGRIVHICEKAGFDVRIGRFDLQGQDILEMNCSNGSILIGEAVRLEHATLTTAKGFVPDVVLVNNDLSTGCPQLLCDAEQLVLPPPGMGWYRRRKSIHFTAYNQVASEFASRFNLDKWLFSTVIHHCGKIDFKERKGLECVAIGVDKAIHAIRQKYEEYGINREPYVYVKADSGTYGMGIMTARSGEEVFEINKKSRNKMNIIKEGVHNTEVIIQEGVPTIDMKEDQTAEPMIYLVAGEPVAHIWRANGWRDAEQSLNASGMVFYAHSDLEMQANPALGLIARLATLAAAYEHYESHDEDEDPLL